MGQQIHSGNRTASTTARLAAKKTEARWIQVQALETNTGLITLRGVGEPGGITLSPGGGYLFPPMGDNPHYDLREIELFAAVAGEGVGLIWYSGDK